MYFPPLFLSFLLHLYLNKSIRKNLSPYTDNPIPYTVHSCISQNDSNTPHGTHYFQTSHQGYYRQFDTTPLLHCFRFTRNSRIGFRWGFVGLNITQYLISLILTFINYITWSHKICRCYNVLANRSFSFFFLRFYVPIKHSFMTLNFYNGF